MLGFLRPLNHHISQKEHPLARLKIDLPSRGTHCPDPKQRPPRSAPNRPVEPNDLLLFPLPPRAKRPMPASAISIPAKAISALVILISKKFIKNRKKVIAQASPEGIL
jgi:hypothetical protein